MLVCTIKPRLLGIRSKGYGRKLGFGRGRGPIGIPYGLKKVLEQLNPVEREWILREFEQRRKFWRI